MAVQFYTPLTGSRKCEPQGLVQVDARERQIDDR